MERQGKAQVTITLHHFLRGAVTVTPEIVDGTREWTDPNRPMMRPWLDCFFLESPDEIDELLATAAAEFQAPNGIEGVGDAARLSSLA